MRFRILFVFIIVSVLVSKSTFAQQTQVKKDSSKVYRNIEAYSVHNKFTKFAYGLFFRPTKTIQKKKVYKKLIKKPYSSLEGKTIRNINIVTLDPFGNSIADTVEVAQNYISRNGNKLHFKTHAITIRNLLLFKKNQEFDSLLVKESERLVRSMGYVTDVSFSFKIVSKSRDSVDIYIRELDKWSLIPKGSISGSRINANLAAKNFAGLGHEFSNGFSWLHKTGNFAYNTNYYIPNIKNTFINSTFHYQIDEFDNTVRSFAIDRPFFSPFAKWAAGVNFSQLSRKDFIENGDTATIRQPVKLNAQDYWAGNATQIFKGNTEDKRTTNFMSAFRFYRSHYLERPTVLAYNQHLFYDETLYIGSIGISTRKYVQDKYIFKFGVTEDVPIGKVYSVTGGYQRLNNENRIYAGTRFSFGNYHPWGYLSTNCEFGTFIRKSAAEQGVVSFGVNYFTGLIEIGKWKFRQFAKPRIILGINRFITDSITINDGFGLDGFNSKSLIGTSRMVFTLQTQSYSPWNFIGFHFGPYFICSVALLGNEKTGFKKSKVYSQLGLGVLIKNDNLVINTFQISFSFYPTIPGNGNNVFKTNSFETQDFGFSDFEIGKPATVIFR
ncbi:MAG: hypothetical protein HOO86_14660 [Bacteroidales bacterium]|nr:hypothetical protein [Bacteroidales bacterium]